MLSLLAALLLTGVPAAHAKDEPAAQNDERDADGDGVVTGKERRQKRRADRRDARRERRAANGQLMTEEEADAADAAEASERTEAASGRAAGAANALKSMLPSADAGGGLPPGGGAGPGSTGGNAGPGTKPSAGPSGLGGHSPSPGAAPAKGSGDPGNPRSPADYALAAHSGYAPAFTAAGLKLAPDGRTVLRLDGKPATAEDYARLQREISAMPAALGRRPDFFSVVSPEHYADLKRGYKEKKEGDQVYKDVGTTEGDRDFVHTASCDKLSGDCNKNVEKDSYKKGDYVAPEALDDMWAALQKELDGSAAEDGNGLPGLGATRSSLAREKALEAARALSGENGRGETLAVSASSATAKLESTPVGQAAAVARRFFQSAAALAFPGSGGESAEGRNPLLAIGAAALAVLGAGILFLRRKG